MVISFFVRLHHLRETGRCPPGLVITITDAQDKARRALYTAALQEPGPSDMDIAQMVHTLCDSLLRASTSSLKKIFGPIEFAFCFYMQKPDGSYRTANNLTQFFASIQWCLRTILGHIIRLQDSGLASYTPYCHLELPPSPDHISPGMFSLYSVSSGRGQNLIYAIERDLSEDVLDGSTSNEWVEEKEDQLEAGLDSDDPLDKSDNSEEEDYPVEEGPGDLMVQENTTLYFHSIVQCDPKSTVSGLNGQILETDLVCQQDSGGLLQYVGFFNHSNSK